MEDATLQKVSDNTTLTVFLRSGATFDIVVESWTVKSSAVTGEITSFSWKLAPGFKAKAIAYLNVEDISAIIESTTF